MFSLAAVTGARESELLGLTWRDVDLGDPEEASVNIAAQVDRHGRLAPLKTEESRRTVELPRSLVQLLLEHKARSTYSQNSSFVFATRSGKAIAQRNVLRELRKVMKRAVTPEGRPTFPVLHEVDERGKPVKVERGSVPNFHSFRHSAVSDAVAAGESIEEVSWQLGHKNSIVTRTVYLQEITTAQRSAKRRAKMQARYGSLLEAASRSGAQQTAEVSSAEVVDLGTARSAVK